MDPRIESLTGAVRGVHMEPVNLSEPFEETAARFANEPGTVVLLSGGELDCARYHILAARPWLAFSARDRQLTLTVNRQTEQFYGHPLRAFQQIVAALSVRDEDLPPPVAAGLFGYLSYDLKDALERLPRSTVDDLCLPHVCFFAPRLLLVQDRRENVSWLCLPRIADISDTPAGLDSLRREFSEALDGAPPAREGFSGSLKRLTSNFSRERYMEAVTRIREYITAGDIYQANLSQRFTTDFTGSAWDLFRELFAMNPAPFFAYIHAGDHRIVSTSPERFIERRGDRVETRPIKGTRPRGTTPEEDRRLREELAASSKDDAELSMIVDLLRNDIGKVCTEGSVRVIEHKRLEAYQNVYHLVTIVEGMLDSAYDSVDLIAAAFPGGSITGCPKVRSMEIIDELETVRRHLYTGSIGYVGFDRNMDLSIAIRTATVMGGRIVFSVGGGIVYDSDPADEFEETLHKGRSLMRVLDGKEPDSGTVPWLWCNGGLMPESDAAVSVTSPGVQYGWGHFETIRVENGRPRRLSAHKERFDRTWAEIMPGPAPDPDWDVVIRQLVEKNRLDGVTAAVKILAARGNRDSAPWDYLLLVTSRPYTHRLTALGVPGLALGTYPHPRQSPLAAHKTLNYLYYARAGQWARENGFNEALITNPDGTISETNTANLLMIFENTVVRPTSDAVLPGVMQQAVCGRLQEMGFTVTSRPITPAELLRADQVFITNALMGAVPICRIDETRLPAPSQLCRDLNRTLGIRL